MSDADMDVNMSPQELEAKFKVLQAVRGKEQLRAIIAGEATFYFTSVKAALPGLVKAYERLGTTKDPDASYLSFTVPIGRVLPEASAFRDLVLWVASSLPVRSGHQSSVRLPVKRLGF